DIALRRAQPVELNGISVAGEKVHHLVERQADDVGIGAVDLDDEGAGKALDGVAAGLAAPLAGSEIGLDVLARQALETHARLDEAAADVALAVGGREPREDAVRTAGKLAQARGSLLDQ